MSLNGEPLHEDITLTLGADFVLTLKVPPSEPIPAGSTVRMALYPKGQKNTLVSIAEWPATVEPTKASWRIESAEADLIPDRAHFRIYISYPEDPTLDLPWYVGDVYRDQ